MSARDNTPPWTQPSNPGQYGPSTSGSQVAVVLKAVSQVGEGKQSVQLRPQHVPPVGGVDKDVLCE